MLRALKWAYDLGVRQERVRIASHLEMVRSGAVVSQEGFRNMLNEDPSMTKTRKDRLKFNMAVSQKVEQIISDIFRDDGQWVPGSSLMFPDDKHKGEFK